MATLNKNGTLFLIPAPIAEGTTSLVIPQGTLEVIRRLKFFIVEEIRTARRFLKTVPTPFPIESLNFSVFNEHSKEFDAQDILMPALAGNDMGLLSEAGLPCVADPGWQIVAHAHQMSIPVTPMTGPSSLMMALMASGLNGQRFAFSGYLPTEKNLLTRKIKELEKKAREYNETQLFIETPYRNLKLFQTLVTTCQESTLLCLAIDLTGTHNQIITKTIGTWKKMTPDIQKVPVLFLLNTEK